MNKHILLGIDASIQHGTRQALRSMSEFDEQAAQLLNVILLHVIPIPSISSPALGMYVCHMQPTLFTSEQRSQAEDVLRVARSELQKQGIAPGHIETLIRLGVPADQIVKVAKELHVDFIVVGSRGSSTKQKMRRIISVSNSRRVPQLDTCPVMIVKYQQSKQPTDLVTRFEKSITLYLLEHTSDLHVLTHL